MSAEEALSELRQFLTVNARLDLKILACKTCSELTGSADGLKLLSTDTTVHEALLKLIRDDNTRVSRESLTTLLNLSSDVAGMTSLLESNIIDEMLSCVANKEFLYADLATDILVNLSIATEGCQLVFKQICESITGLDGIVRILCQLDYNVKKCQLYSLAPLIANLSQLNEARELLLQNGGMLFQQFLPMMAFPASEKVRKSILSVVHNCCFDNRHHSWLLSEEVDLLPRLLMPLSGPDVYTYEENESLPIDLQFLPEDKQCDADPEVRKLALESLMQLCSVRKNREMIRNQNAYLILREHHKWEADPTCILFNEDLVNILIRTEAEIGAEDLSAIDVPLDVASTFQEMDANFLKGNDN